MMPHPFGDQLPELSQRPQTFREIGGHFAKKPEALNAAPRHRGENIGVIPAKPVEPGLENRFMPYGQSA